MDLGERNEPQMTQIKREKGKREEERSAEEFGSIRID
jgi:hypothetical protein